MVQYLKPMNQPGAESDLSVTGSQILFLRSAANAGFDIPQEYIDEATDYVKRSFNRQQKEFFYSIGTGHQYATRRHRGGLAVPLSHRQRRRRDRAPRGSGSSRNRSDPTTSR